MAASRREQILSTAAALFAQHGFHGVSVADQFGMPLSVASEVRRARVHGCVQGGRVHEHTFQRS